MKRGDGEGETYDFSLSKVLKIGAPCPDSYPIVSKVIIEEAREHMGENKKRYIPRTTISATRYGKGRLRLKESSSGSTAGSPSIVIANGRYTCDAASNRGVRESDWSWSKKEVMRVEVLCKERRLEISGTQATRGCFQPHQSINHVSA